MKTIAFQAEGLANAFKRRLDLSFHRHTKNPCSSNRGGTPAGRPFVFFAVGIEGGWPKTIYSVIGLLISVAP
jgi:hypothetical protein